MLFHQARNYRQNFIKIQLNELLHELRKVFGSLAMLMVLQAGSLFTKAVACGLNNSSCLGSDSFSQMLHKMSGPHTDKFYLGSSKRPKFLTIVLKNTISPSFYLRRMLIHTSPRSTLAWSKMRLYFGATSSRSRKSPGWKKYGNCKRAVALVVNPTGYTMLWDNTELMLPEALQEAGKDYTQPRSSTPI